MTAESSAIIAIQLGRICASTESSAPRTPLSLYPRYAAILVAIGPGKALAMASVSPNSSSVSQPYRVTASCRISGMTDGPPP
ncbi:hypothetical protein D3C74_464880 [compost metagenome]